MNYRVFRLFALILCGLFATSYVAAQIYSPVGASVPGAAAVTTEEPASIKGWLMRMHEASQKRAYIGTFVVSSGGVITSAKIWNVCDGNQQMERIETLTGAPRSIFRRNDQVVTFIPDQKLVRRETRESLGIFSKLLQSTDGRISDFYKLRQIGVERVAGVQANIVELTPRDRLRFGYRVWTEQKTDMVVKLQTLDPDGKVLEQAAFSELQVGAPVSMNKLIQLMDNVKGYRVEKSVLVKTTASAEGWILKAPVPGFEPMRCYKRPAAATDAAAGIEPLQWIFSDGLALVSVFVEPLDRQSHREESGVSLGATHAMTRRLEPYWITVMGEAPLATLQLFANQMERKKP